MDGLVGGERTETWTERERERETIRRSLRLCLCACECVRVCVFVRLCLKAHRPLARGERLRSARFLF